MINPIYHEQTNHHRGWVRNTLGSEEPILNLTEYLEGLNIFDPEDLLNTLLRKIAVEPVSKEVQWWEAQGRFENLIEAEFRRGGDYQAVLR